VKKYLFALFLLFPGSDAARAGEKAQARLPVRVITIERADGSAETISAELARTEEEQARGLMFRKSLKDGEAMLFIFRYDKILAFWMKNTLIPLSVAYIGRDGVIREIHDMRPGNLSPVRSGRSLRYALEVPQGYFERKNIRPGDRLVLNGPGEGGENIPGNKKNTPGNERLIPGNEKLIPGNEEAHSGE